VALLLDRLKYRAVRLGQKTGIDRFGHFAGLTAALRLKQFKCGFPGGATRIQLSGPERAVFLQGMTMIWKSARLRSTKRKN
jgi:hypothetical protein